VFAGDADPADSGLYPYELVLTPGRGCGAEFVDAAENGAFSRAMDEVVGRVTAVMTAAGPSLIRTEAHRSGRWDYRIPADPPSVRPRTITLAKDQSWRTCQRHNRTRVRTRSSRRRSGGTPRLSGP